MGITTIETVRDLRRSVRALRHDGKRVALVPTMGALHEGHLSLVRAARERADVVVMSIFVNPTQFGPHEDCERYPRDLERDRALAGEAGVDLLFHPAVEEIYPEGDATRVEVGRVADGLCGASRPGHFRGVATVVAKLLIACEPDMAVFGRKDYQQWRVIERMVRDLRMGVEIIGAPIVREADGLALSSRNAYLSKAQRTAALALPRALAAGADAAGGDERNAARIRKIMTEVVGREPDVRLDYLAVVDPQELQPVELIEGAVLLAGALFVGSTRLIDNRELA